MRATPARLALLASVLALAGCGSHEPPTASSSSGAWGAAHVPAGDWPMFDYNAQRSGVGPANTGITAGNVGLLTTRTVQLDGTVDSSPIELHNVRVLGRIRDVIVVTTSYGHTIALDPSTGRQLWEYRAPGAARFEGSLTVTTATPVADPDRRHIYAASPDGLIHKLTLQNGGEVRSGHWPARITRDPVTEKIGGALNLSGHHVLAVVGGQEQNTPSAEHYQGHLAVIDRASGEVVGVFNSLCSDHHEVMVPATCNANDAGIWARAGVVVEPGGDRLLVGTGNGHFNGRTWWGDSVLELSSDGSHLFKNWTPADQATLDSNDTDIGSTAPALLPEINGRHLLVQGGKDGAVRLLDLDRLNGTTGGAGPRTSGELQTISTVGGGAVFTAPSVWKHGGRVYVFVGEVDALAAYTVAGAGNPELVKLWSISGNFTSPVIAGGLLYAFDTRDRVLDIVSPVGGQVVRGLPASIGHWDSPIAIGGRIVLPVGDYQRHLTTGQLLIYHLPGR